ncbi:MAG: GIY-YIG nuclease family protein [Bacteroidales bacterium]|nr:GIY-YIG nuclease family protein [Bacteroidales bacterium]
MSKGYVYVMINSSMNGLVKIGKTEKAPEERAKELSTATGIATPFTVVYKRMFNDCDKAEKNAHAILSERGYRVNNKREFFSIDIPEAIDLIINLPDSEVVENEEEIDEEDTENYGEMYYDLGNDYYYGWNDTFVDLELAFSYYEKSAELGYWKAFEELGKIYLYDYKKDSKAINYFRKGAEKGIIDCYAHLGKIYMNHNSDCYNEHNADLAWDKFFNLAYKSNASNHSLQITEYLLATHIYKELITINPIFEAIIKCNIADIMEKMTDRMNGSSPKERESSSYLYRGASSYLANLAQELFSMVICKSNYSNIITKSKILNNTEITTKEQNYLTAYEYHKKLYSEVKYNFDGVDNFSNALKYYKKSAIGGYMNAYAKIGCVYCVMGKYEKAKENWDKFYNYVHKCVIEDKSFFSMTQSQKYDIILEFLDIIYIARIKGKKDLLHPYYTYIMIAGDVGKDFIEFYSFINKEILNENQHLAIIEANIWCFNVINSYIKELAENVKNTDGVKKVHVDKLETK